MAMIASIAALISPVRANFGFNAHEMNVIVEARHDNRRRLARCAGNEKRHDQ